MSDEDESSRRSDVTIAQQTTEGSTIATERPDKEALSVMIRVELTPGFDGSKLYLVHFDAPFCPCIEHIFNLKTEIVY